MCVCVCVFAYVRACVRACLSVFVCVCEFVCVFIFFKWQTIFVRCAKTDSCRIKTIAKLMHTFLERSLGSSNNAFENDQTTSKREGIRDDEMQVY